MSKSLTYLVNNTPVEVPAGNTVPLGSVIRRYGCATTPNGNVVNLCLPGYYNVCLAATFTGSAAGTVIVKIQQDGVDVPGATATETITTADTEFRSVALCAAVRLCNCCNSTLSVVVDAASVSDPTFTDVALKIEKV